MRPETVAVKKQYEKPMLHVIDLAADEVLGVGCKATSGAAQQAIHAQRQAAVKLGASDPKDLSSCISSSPG